jgi:hypothetical protein
MSSSIVVPAREAACRTVGRDRFGTSVFDRDLVEAALDDELEPLEA